MSKVSDHEYGGAHSNPDALKRQDLLRLVQELRAENQQFRESHTALKETERALRLLVDSLPGVAYRYRIKNRWILDFIGENSSELCGYPSEYFVEEGHNFVELIHPDDMARVLQCASEGVTNRQPFSSEYRIQAADGTEKWVLEKGQGVWEGNSLVGTEGFILDITAQKRAQLEITESEERHRSLVELCPDGIAIHDGIHLLYGNAVALELFGGTTLEEAQRRTIADVIRPDYRELARKRIAAMMRGESTPLVEEVFVRADGTCFDAEVAARPIVYQGNPAVLVIFRDITSRKKTRQRLQEALSRFEAVIEQTPLVAIQGVDRDGKIRHWNRASAALFGLQAKEVEGKRLQDILTTPDRTNSFLESVQRVWDTRQALPPCEWEFLLPTGVRRWVYATIFPVIQDGVTEEAFVMQIDITSRRQMEEELRQTQELLRSIVVNLPLAVFLKDAKEFRFLLWNKCNEEMLGLSEAEVLYKTDYDLFPKEQADGFREADLKTIQAGRLTDTPEEPITSTSGTRILHTRKIPIFNSKGEPTFLLGISVDVTEQKRAEQALRESEAKYHTLFQFFPDPVFLETPEGAVIDCNTVACDVYGYDKASMAKLKVADLVPCELVPRLSEMFEGLTEGRLIEAVGKTRDGKLFPAEVTARFIDVGGQTQVLVHVRDITERKRAEEERAKLESQILQAQKLESLGVLAGGIAHDFNNLLTAVLGYADLTEAELPPSSPLRDNVHQIAQTARRGAELTKQMLAYSGRGKFSIQRVCISHVVEEMTHLLKVSISKKCLLQCHFAPNLPDIEADTAQMRQVVMNLIINASEAIGDNNGAITITTGTVNCDRGYLAEAYLDENLPLGPYVYLEVADTGCGMNTETRAKIFDPFFTTKFTGRGLGLAAVLGIVRGHRGAIKVYSEPGKGTSFKVLFPACEAHKTTPVAAEHPLRPNWQGRGTVLVVDDEDMVRALAQKMLMATGLNVITASNGREALEVFQENADKIDLVLLDMTMPQMGGEETFQELRRCRPDARVILSSGYSETDVTARFSGKGLAGFIQKPYVSEELIDLVRRIMEFPQ